MTPMSCIRVFRSWPWGGLALLVVACAGGWFTAGPRPSALVGRWVDLASATPRDTVVWDLASNGVRRMTRITLSRSTADSTPVPRMTVRTIDEGLWYVSGALSDSIDRAFCFKRRSRDGATCRHFRLDTLARASEHPLRRLVILADDRGQARDEVFLERSASPH